MGRERGGRLTAEGLRHGPARPLLNLPGEPKQPEEPQQNKRRETAGLLNEKLALRGNYCSK